MTIDTILDKLLEDIVDANFNGYNYALVKPAKAELIQLIEEERERAFAGGFGAGGGEVYNLDIAWKLYNNALKHKPLKENV